MERTPVVAGNWKMELSHKAALETAAAIKKFLKDVSVSLDAVVFPSFTALPAVAREFEKSQKIQIGAQNVHWEEKGAWTGEVGVSQIKPFAKWCIVGHSERRALVGEEDGQVRAKVELLLKHGITPIACLGESEHERAAGQAVEKITRQADILLQAVTRVSVAKLVIAYEPIWAIGSGEQANPDEAAELMLLIRKLAAERFGNEAAQRLRIIYGGSVTADTIEPFVSEPGIDGALIGGASLRPMQFVECIKVTENYARTTS